MVLLVKKKPLVTEAYAESVYLANFDLVSLQHDNIFMRLQSFI